MYAKEGYDTHLNYGLIPADISLPVQRKRWPKEAREDPFRFARDVLNGWPEIVPCGDEDGPWENVMMLVDEDGKFKLNSRFNLRASILYGFFQHGNYLVGDAVLVGRTSTQEAKNLDRDRFRGLEPYFARVIEREYDHYIRGIIASRYLLGSAVTFLNGR